MEISVTLRKARADDRAVAAEITDSRYPWPLVLHFDSTAEDAALIGFEIRAPEALDPEKVKRVAASLGLYTDYARAWFRADRAEARREAGEAVEILKTLGATKRGMPDRFYETIGREVAARRRAGEPFGVKAIAAAHWVDKSTASRWLKEARRRGYLDEKGDKSNA